MPRQPLSCGVFTCYPTSQVGDSGDHFVCIKDEDKSVGDKLQ